jgi:hypothetical protein
MRIKNYSEFINEKVIKELEKININSIEKLLDTSEDLIIQKTEIKKEVNYFYN